MTVPGQTSVRPEERQGVVLAFVTLLGILASYALLETARDALFLARLSPTELPGVYLVMAVVAVGLAELPGRGLRLPNALRLPAMLLFGAAGTLGFFFLRPAASWGPRSGPASPASPPDPCRLGRSSRSGRP